MAVLLDYKWYVLYTRPRSEKSVSERIMDQGCLCYLPLYSKVTMWRNRKIKRELPLFPCYVFVFATRSILYKLYNINGVIKAVSFNSDQPAIIPDEDIELLRRVKEIDANDTIESEEYFNIGTNVIIQKGSFRGVKGEVIEKRGKKRLLIQLESIKNAVSIEINSIETCVTCI